MAKKLTMLQRRRLDQDRRLRPAARLLRERRRALRAQLRARTWLNADGTSTIGSDPGLDRDARPGRRPRRLVRLRQAAAASPPALGQEFSADNAFETGKVAMNDRRRVPHRLHQGRGARTSTTAPRRSRPPTARPTCTAPATSPATSIGIGQGLEEPRGRLGADQVPDDEHRHRRSSSPTASRTCPTTHRRAARRRDLRGATQYQTFLDIFADTRTRTTPASADRHGVPGHLRARSPSSGRRARSPTSPAGLKQVDTADQRPARPRPGAVTLVAESARRRSPTAPGCGDGGGGTGSPCWRSSRPGCSACSIFFVYPLVATLYLCFTRFDLLSPPQWVGLAQLRVHVHQGPAGRHGGAQHAVARGDPGAGPDAVRAGRRRRSSSGSRPASGSSAPCSTCRRSCRRWRRRSRSSSCSTPPPGRSTRSSARSACRSRSGSTTRPGPSRRWCCSASGASATS